MGHRVLHHFVVPGLAAVGVLLFIMPLLGMNTGQVPDVMAAQSRLAVLRYYPGPVDGILGGNTRAAIAGWRAWTGETDHDGIPRSLLIIDQIVP